MMDKKVGELVKVSSPIVNFGTVEVPKFKIVHKEFNEVLKLVEVGIENILLVGSAGTGKSRLAKDVADALKLDFYPMSVGLQTSKSDLLGFVNGSGIYMTTAVRMAYENGGVLLIDELDAGNAGVLTILNNILSGSEAIFPDGKLVKKHEKFVVIATANTYGTGATMEYVGRNRLDAATLNRFIVKSIGYDEGLEKTLANNDKWSDIVVKARKHVEEEGIKLIISTRNLLNGAKMLANEKYDILQVVNTCILSNANNEDVETKIFNAIKEDIARY